VINPANNDIVADHVVKVQLNIYHYSHNYKHCKRFALRSSANENLQKLRINRKVVDMTRNLRTGLKIKR